MRILVTGGAGRLGSEVVKLIAACGHTAWAFDLPHVPFDAIEDVPGVETFKGDITDPEDVAEACGVVDGVIHLAALLPPRSEEDREATMRVNVGGTRNIVETLKRQPGKPLIFASSVSTYGVTAHESPPIGEDHPLRGHDNYSESKIEAERIIRGSGVPYSILRISAVAVADLVELPDIIPYRSDQRVEFIYVVDAAQALLSAFENPEARGRAFNIAGGSSWQVTGGEYIQRFYDALGVEVEPRFSEAYTGLDWYETSRSRFLGYQRATLNGLLERLREIGERLGLR
ncbi:MAG: NAD-dependent epimerase/dehydratase family protein [Candidatus Bathyarchaeia archaeon]